MGLPSRLRVRETVTISTSGLSVVGIAQAMLDYMKIQDNTYPSQFEVDVNSEARTLTITRNFDRKIQDL